MGMAEMTYRTTSTSYDGDSPPSYEEILRIKQNRPDLCQKFVQCLIFVFLVAGISGAIIVRSIQIKNPETNSVEVTKIRATENLASDRIKPPMDYLAISSKGTKFYQSTKNNDLPINQTGHSKLGETKEFVISTDEPSETQNGSTLKAQFYFDEPKKVRKIRDDVSAR